MRDAEADSAVDGQEQALPADSTATGQEQGDQSAEKRINGLMSLAQRRTAERDAAQAEIDALRVKLQSYETAAVDELPGRTQQELMYPERFAEPEVEAEAVDPMAPPEPPTIINMQVNPSRTQSAPLGVAPVLGDLSSPSAQYAQAQSEIAAMKQRLNVAGQQWVDDARERGLMD